MNVFNKAKARAKNEKKTLDCIMCGKEFVPYRGSLERGWGRFCSKSCSAEFRNVAERVSPAELKSLERAKALRELGL
jgi:hypothetical protein